MQLASSDHVQEHSNAIARLRFLATLIKPEEVAAAFVASLGTRKLEYRSALGSYAIARVIPDHPLDKVPGAYASICRFCGWSQMPPGEEPSTDRDLFERKKFGGLRHEWPSYARRDLELFRKLEPVEPSSEDWHRLEMILRAPSRLPPTAKASDLQRSLQGVFPSNKSERTVLIQILAYAGVLEAENHPGYFDRYVPGDEQEMPPYHFLDWGYPAIWWRASDGYREDALAYWFPQISPRLRARCSK